MIGAFGIFRFEKEGGREINRMAKIKTTKVKIKEKTGIDRDCASVEIKKESIKIPKIKDKQKYKKILDTVIGLL